MQIKLASVMVDDQDKALHFYTSVLGFLKQAGGGRHRSGEPVAGEPG
jgi:catechol 2,3-dioxygenase-like lactoylglutathione lyase family enzyme